MKRAAAAWAIALAAWAAEALGQCPPKWHPDDADPLNDGPAVGTQEAEQMLQAAADLCRAMAKPAPWPVWEKTLLLVRLAPYAPPQAAQMLAGIAAQMPARHHQAAWALASAAQWLQDQYTPLAAKPNNHPGSWRWLGPFGAEHGTAFGRQGAVETEARQNPAGAGSDTAAARDGKAAWQALPSGPIASGGARVNLTEWVDRPDDAIVYAQTWLRLPGAATATAAVLHTQSQGQLRIWLGGRLVTDLAEQPPPDGFDSEIPPPPPAEATAVTLGPQWQRMLIKVAAAGAKIEFAWQFADAAGRPLAVEARAEAPPLTERAAQPATAALANLAQWWQPAMAAAGNPAVKSVLLQMAWHGWRLPPDVFDTLLGWQPEELPQSAAAALAHANLPGEAGDRLQRLEQWRDLLPQDEAVALAAARALGDSGQPALALRQWQQFWERQHKPKEPKKGQAPAKTGPEGVQPCLQQLQILRAAQADVLADQRLDACVAEAKHRKIREAVLQRARQQGHGLPASTVRWAQEATPWASVETLQDALARGDWPTADRHIAALVAAHPARTRLLESAARAKLDRQAPGDLAAAERDLQAVPPPLRRTAWHELFARAALLQGNRPAAVAALQTAAALSPHRADLRARLRLFKADREFYADLRRDLLALVQKERNVPRKHPFEVRLRQTVLQGLGNGQQARFDSEVIYIGPNGPQSHAVDVDYVPAMSEAEIVQAAIVRKDGRIDRQIGQTAEQTSDDSSGMYGDSARISLAFRNLKPGDSVVVEYEVRDLGPTPFGLVFGELLPLGDVVPVRETEVAIRLPAATPLHYAVYDPNRPDAAQPPPVERTLAADASAGESAMALREWRWKFGALAAAANEPSAPSAVERIAVLHASSFADWPAAAAWFQALLRDALPQPGADPVVSELARRLAAGKTSDEAKVRAVYEFARAQVRYVGLEFGIHTIKPHSPQQVAQRQFGDCKDKATLIVALLAELGIDAQVALVRTSDLGQLHDGIASLGIFNHAIAYVPALNWWLDATAVPNGPLELPEGDAGGVALRIGAGAPLQVLPEPDSQREKAAVEVRIDVAPDGKAAMHWVGKFGGLAAAEMRAGLAGNGGKPERIEQELAPRWPGVAVKSVALQGVDRQADEVTVTLDATLPAFGKPQNGQWRVAPLRPSKSLAETWVGLDHRETPLLLKRPLAVSETVEIRMPAGWRAATLPAAIEGSGPAASFAVRAESKAAGAVATAQWSVRERTTSPKDYAKLRAFFDRLDAALRSELVFSAAEAP